MGDGKRRGVDEQMQKAYVTNAVIGDGRMLATLSRTGELERVYWPTIDGEQYVRRLWLGWREDVNGQLQWLHEDRRCVQRYEEDSNVLLTAWPDADGWDVSQSDFVPPDMSLVVRRLQFANRETQSRRLIVYVRADLQLAGHAEGNAVRVELSEQALVHYRRGAATATASDARLFGYQAGDVKAALAHGQLLGVRESLGQDGALAYDLGIVGSGESQSVHFFVAFGATRSEALATLRTALQTGAGTLLARTRAFWQAHLAQARPVRTGEEKLDALYRRSLLVFGMMADRTYGGLIAAPEFDPEWALCGGYGYCWGRDAAYIATAIGQAGFTRMSERFYDWALRAQDDDGGFAQRHFMDGSLAPAWGLQIDETASVVWGMWQHYRLTENRAFLARVWGAMQRGADFLDRFVDRADGLPRESRDLWEERFARHTYSAAAVCAALEACADAAELMGAAERARIQWRATAVRVREAISLLWDDGRGCFDRAARLHFALPENMAGESVVEVDDYGYEHTVQLRDKTVDASLLGISYPFAVFPESDLRLVRTAEMIRERLWIRDGVGGVMRYEGDRYVDGNPWVLTTLWLGLEALRRGDVDTARSVMRWAADRQTDTGLLPEQVDPQTGEPRWVVPLTWSHAMFVLLAIATVDKGTWGKPHVPEEPRDKSDFDRREALDIALD